MKNIFMIMLLVNTSIFAMERNTKKKRYPVNGNHVHLIVKDKKKFSCSPGFRKLGAHLLTAIYRSVIKKDYKLQ